jgi:nucleoside-diphosphate-sugar epimerase
VPVALVTGATGLLGSYIAERLCADGWSVRALVRDPARAAWLDSLGCSLHRGDTLDAAAFSAAARGCDVIFHAAAAVTPRGGWEAYRRPNVDGTRNAIDAARLTGARLLHVSSVAVYGGSRYQRDDRPTDEQASLGPLPDSAWYARSKRESEAAVLDAHQAGRVWATAIRPCVVYGRRDRQFTPRAARLFSSGFAPLVGGGRATIALVHAANVADAAVRAVHTDAAGGNAYNTTNDFPITFAELVRLAAAGLGRRVTPVRIPVSVARAAARLAGLLAARRGAGGARMVASSSVHFLTRGNPFTSERARRDLGWAPPMRHEIGVPEAFRWWKENR